MFCYRFPDRATFLALAAAEGLTTTDENGNESVVVASHSHAIDEIGPIISGGEWDEEGNVIVPPTVIDGHHCNVQGIAPEAWDEYMVVVNSAARIFLGGPSSAPPDNVLEEMIE